jgi:D-arabinonate dehydratase
VTVNCVEAWTVPLPLRRPVIFGSLCYESRDYCVVRVRTSEGAEGVGWGLGRGAPIAEAVQALAPLVIGADPWCSQQIWQRMYESSIPYGQRGISMRALSLLDIALWDLKGRAAGVPVWQLLGGARRDIPASVGGGYFRDQRPADEIADELRGYVERGVRHIKIPAGGWSVTREAEWVRQAREAVGSHVALAVDAHWTWRDVSSAQAVLRTWEDADLAWVEDPLWPEAVVAAASLRRSTRVPIAIGDELSGRWAYQSLLLSDAADIWRIDVTTVGGFTEAGRIAALASTWGIALSTHIYPELHVHLAASDSAVVALEYTEPAADIDLAYRFVTSSTVCRDGSFTAPDASGLAVTLDWDLIEASAVRHVKIV